MLQGIFAIMKNLCLKLQTLWEITKPLFEKVGVLCRKRRYASFDSPLLLRGAVL